MIYRYITQLLLEADYSNNDYQAVYNIVMQSNEIVKYIEELNPTVETTTNEGENENIDNKDINNKDIRAALKTTLGFLNKWKNKTNIHNTYTEFENTDSAAVQAVFILAYLTRMQVININVLSIQINTNEQVYRTLIKTFNKLPSDILSKVQSIVDELSNKIEQTSTNAAQQSNQQLIRKNKDYIQLESEHYYIYVTITIRAVRELGLPGVWCVSSGSPSTQLGYLQRYAGDKDLVFVILQDKNDKKERFSTIYSILGNRFDSIYDKHDNKVGSIDYENEVLTVLKQHEQLVVQAEAQKEYEELTNEAKDFIVNNIYKDNAYEVLSNYFGNLHKIDLYIATKSNIDITKITDNRLLQVLPYVYKKFLVHTNQIDKISIDTTDDILTLLTVYKFNNKKLNERLWRKKNAIVFITELLGIKEYEIMLRYDNTYAINVPGSVDISERLRQLEIKYLPIQFNYVQENFDCSDNNLISLEGAPQTVGGGFYCSDNNLISLKGAPQTVSGKFNCSYNKLTTLEGAPQTVGGYFDCSDNKLTTLEGAPQTVSGKFACNNNKLTTLEGAPQTVSGDFDCSDNNLTSLKGAPQIVGGYFDCSYNNLTDEWEQWAAQNIRASEIIWGAQKNIFNESLINIAVRVVISNQ